MIYDISQPLEGCEVYPGDPRPELRRVSSMEEGDLYNLTVLSLCAHNGTHVDAPRHFIREGKSIGDLAPDIFFGPAYAAKAEGELSAEAAEEILERARKAGRGAWRRLLLKGKLTVTPEAAEVFARAELLLLGNESQSVGPMEAPMEVHLRLLGAGTVLLEGIRLDAVPEGAWLLSCAPLNLGEAEGAPCRALLTELPQG